MTQPVEEFDLRILETIQSLEEKWFRRVHELLTCLAVVKIKFVIDPHPCFLSARFVIKTSSSSLDRMRPMTGCVLSSISLRSAALNESWESTGIFSMMYFES